MAPGEEPIELIPGTHRALGPGRYRRSAFEPRITFSIGAEDGSSVTIGSSEPVS
jgi:hypothetical protein